MPAEWCDEVGRRRIDWKAPAVVRKNTFSGSKSFRGDFFQPIFVMQATENRRHYNSAIRWNAVFGLVAAFGELGSGIPGPKAGVWAGAIVMFDQHFSVCRMCASLMGIIKSKHSRRAVPIQRSQMAFTLGLFAESSITISPNVFRPASKSRE